MDIEPEFDIGPMDMDPGGFDVPAPGFDDIDPAPPDLPMEDAGSFDRPLPDWDQGPEAVLPDNLDVVPEEPVPLPFVELQPVDEPLELAPAVVRPDAMEPSLDVSVPSIEESSPTEDDLPNTIVSPESSPEEEVLSPAYPIAPENQVDSDSNSSVEIDAQPDTTEPADYSFSPEDLVSNPTSDSLLDQPPINDDGDLHRFSIPSIETLPESIEPRDYPIAPREIPGYQYDEVVPDQVPSGDVSPESEILIPAPVAPEIVPDGFFPDTGDIPSMLPEAEIEPDVVQEPPEDEAAYAGPEQTEIYHSPEDTREIEPGVGHNPSWVVPPDSNAAESTVEDDPSETRLIEEQEPDQNLHPASPQEKDVVEDEFQAGEISNENTDEEQVSDQLGTKADISEELASSIDNNESVPEEPLLQDENNPDTDSTEIVYAADSQENNESENIPEDLVNSCYLPSKVEEKLGKDTIWDDDPFSRGRSYEDLKEVNIGGNFQTIDDFQPESGTVTSLKTIDLNAPSYINGENDQLGSSHLRTTMIEYIDKLDAFEGAKQIVNGEMLEISEDDIQDKVLAVGIPQGSLTEANATALSECKTYAAEKNIKLLIEEVP